MATKTTDYTSLKVFMFPWLAYGHVTPFLELAKKLSDRGFIIHFCSTPINLEFIKKKIPEKYFPSIHPVALHLPDPETPQLPPSHHTTNGLPPHLMSTLRIALARAKPNLSRIFKTLSPDLVIYDPLQSWTASLTSVHNIPAVRFSTTSVASFAYGCHALMKPGAEFPFPALHLSGFHQAKANSSIESGVSNAREEDPEDDRRPNRFCDSILLVKSSREIEGGKYMDYLSDMTGMKIVPAGALFPDSVVNDDRDDDEHRELIQWLETKSHSSTVFVSFGSEYFLTNEEMEEIALGLELSNVNFIWVLRFPMGEIIRAAEALPDGFLERVENRGRIVEGWAQQREILVHPSIGGFVSHCGWNSVLESIELGVPIIAMPMNLDQPLNARLVADIGVAVEVMRDGNGKLEREAIAQVIKEVVAVDREGEDVMRRKLKDVRGKMKLRENEELDEVVELLKQLI